jgi:hypothetical protein
VPTLNVTLNDKNYAIHVPDEMLAEAEDFFRKMDRDMDRGWQMSRDFVEHPDPTQRAQIAAHRIMLAMSTDNETLAQLLSGYILKRQPGVTGVVVDTEGDMTRTEIVYGAGAAPATDLPAASGKLSRLGAMKQAGKEVTAVYKSGRSFRFAVLDRATGQWVESAALDDEQEAQERRMQAFKRRFEEISG